MQLGKFRHRISVERPVEVQAADGTLSTTWQVVPGFDRIAAEVLPDRASEFFGAAQVQNTENALIRLRWQPGIDTTMRVKHALRPDLIEYWKVEGHLNFQDRQKELRLMCLKRDAEGFRRGADLVNAL